MVYSALSIYFPVLIVLAGAALFFPCLTGHRNREGMYDPATQSWMSRSYGLGMAFGLVILIAGGLLIIRSAMLNGILEGVINVIGSLVAVAFIFSVSSSKASY